MSFHVSHPPVDVAVDTKRNFVYTVGGWHGSRLLSKYDVAAGIETTIDLGAYGVGIAVEEIKGMINELKKDKLIQEVFGQSLFAKYLQLKTKEWNEFKTQITPWEIDKCLDVY